MSCLLRRMTSGVFLALLALGLGACNDSSELTSGEYQVTEVRDDSCDAEMGCDATRIAGATFTLSRKDRTAVLDFGDGEVLDLTWQPRDRSQWPEGCPTNTGHTKMEVGVITEAPLVVDWMLFENPVLVAGCPAGSRYVTLTEDGDLWGGAGCGVSEGSCITFRR